MLTYTNVYVRNQILARYPVANLILFALRYRMLRLFGVYYDDILYAYFLTKFNTYIVNYIALERY